MVSRVVEAVKSLRVRLGQRFLQGALDEDRRDVEAEDSFVTYRID